MKQTTHHEIKLKSELLDIPKKELCDVVETELNMRSSVLGLDEPYCQNAGSVGAIHVNDLDFDPFEEEADHVSGTFNIDFEESYYNGCKDIGWRLKWSGSAQFTLTRSSGELAFDLEATEMRDDDE